MNTQLSWIKHKYQSLITIKLDSDSYDRDLWRETPHFAVDMLHRARGHAEVIGSFDAMSRRTADSYEACLRSSDKIVLYTFL